MKRPNYPTDLTNLEWRKLERLLPAEKRGGRPRKHAQREVLDAIFYLVRAGYHWRLLPAGFPPWKTVYHYFRRWRLDGLWQRVHGRLRSLCRQRGWPERQAHGGHHRQPERPDDGARRPPRL